MGAIKGIDIKPIKIDLPPINDLKPIEIPRLAIAGDSAFPIIEKSPSASLAEVDTRLGGMTITPDLSKNPGIKYFILSRPGIKSQVLDTHNLEIAAVVLAGVLGVLIEVPEVASWVEKYAQAIISLFGIMALPSLGMVASGGGSKKAPDPVLSTIAEGLKAEADRLEQTADSIYKKHPNYRSLIPSLYHGDRILEELDEAEFYRNQAQKLRREAEHVLGLSKNETLTFEGIMEILSLEAPDYKKRIPYLQKLETRGPGVYVITEPKLRYERDPGRISGFDLLGYQLKAGFGEDEINLKINTIDHRTVETIHKFFASRFDANGSAHAALESIKHWMPGYFDLSLLEVKDSTISLNPAPSATERRSQFPNQVFPWESIIGYSTTPPFVIEYTTSEGSWTQYDFSSTQLPALRLTNVDHVSEGDKRIRISDPRLEDADVTLSRTSDGRFSVFNKKGKVYILRKSGFIDSEETVFLKFPIQEGHSSFENPELQTLDLKTDTLVINKIVFKFKTKENEGSPSNDGNPTFPGLEITHFTNYEDFYAAHDTLEKGELDPKTIFWEGFRPRDLDSEKEYIWEIHTIGTLNRDDLKIRVDLYMGGNLEDERKPGPGPWESFSLLIDTPSPLTYDSEFYGDTWSTHILIKTKDPLIAKSIHQQFAKEYIRTGSARAALDWLRRRPESAELLEIPPMIGEEEKLPEETVQWLKENPWGSVNSALIGALEDPSPLIRRSAAESLGIVGGPEEALHILTALLFERDGKVKATLLSVFKSLKQREPESLNLINSFFRKLQSNPDLTPDGKKVFLRYLKAIVEDENP